MKDVLKQDTCVLGFRSKITWVYYVAFDGVSDSAMYGPSMSSYAAALNDSGHVLSSMYARMEDDQGVAE